MLNHVNIKQWRRLDCLQPHLQSMGEGEGESVVSSHSRSSVQLVLQRENLAIVGWHTTHAIKEVSNGSFLSEEVPLVIGRLAP